MEAATSPETLEQTYYYMLCNNLEDNYMNQSYQTLSLQPSEIWHQVIFFI